MRATWWTRAAHVAGAFALLVASAAPAAAVPEPERGARRRAFNLFAVTNAVMDVNRVFCGINNLGEICVDPTNSPVLGGGFWPKGTPNQYIFNSGLQIAGVIDPAAGFAWAGDTTGAYFFDARGTQVQGDAVTLVFNSLDEGDAAAWPNGAVVRDTAIYNSVLIGRNAVSQQDLWTRAWDGNPALISGRTHPMGILVEERGLAWNFPTGNEDIIYFVFRFYNITARTAAVYNNPTIEPAVQAEIAAVGAQFQDRNEAAFNVQIPDGGYAITNLFAAFSMDPDVGNAGVNYSTAILPFQMGVAYKADFLEPTWAFPPEIFTAPDFAAAPGFIGVKYLKSPVVAGQPVGLSMFSNTLNAATGFPDPVGVIQLWRYLSGTASPAFGDNPCTVANPQGRRLCFLAQNFADTRFFQSSGPFTLAPGEAQTIVVAYVHAAPRPAVAAWVGEDLKPGIPPSGADLATGADTLRVIERAVGWEGDPTTQDLVANGGDGDGVVDQDEVQTFPRSLLNKALVAQAVFDNKFLLPFAPEPPAFFLVPQDNQVTVAWKPSPTENAVTGGDPFFDVASDNTSPLYDPNFRKFDVEGYRIYRGRTTSQLDLIAQFDYSGTSLIDYTGAFAYPTDEDEDGVSECAPELGITDDCPVDFAGGESEEHALVGDVIQIPAGGRVELASGDVLILRADTAVSGGGSAFPELEDTAVPFVFIDRGVRNSFRYFYAVTAFDVNSLKSGPSSLESPRITKPVTPRKASGQETAGVLQDVQLIGGDGSTLSGTMPTIDPATGIFSGPQPPSDGVSLGLAAFLPQVLDDGSVTLTIDSVVAGNGYTGAPAVYYLTGQGAGAPVSFAMNLPVDGFDEDHSNSAFFPATTISGTKSGRFGADATFSLYGEAALSTSGGWKTTQWARANINDAPGNSSFNSPRWWAGAANENVNDPNGLQCPGSPGDCVIADPTRNAGQLPGVDTLFHPHAYATVPNVPMRDFEAITATVTRAADFEVTWGAGGQIASVVDVVHKVPVPYAPNIRASWGILNQSSFATTTETDTPDGDNTILTWSDIFCVDPVPAELGQCDDVAVLEDSATLSPIAARSSTFAATASLAATGTGFIFYLNGHFFLMQLDALPAAGTVWHARFYAGTIIGTPGSYSFTPAIRPPPVPGLQVRVAYQGSSYDPTTVSDEQLARIHTVPDPYYVTNPLEVTANTKVLRFVNLPSQAIIRIYSVSGVLVQVLNFNDPTAGGETTWNLRNRNNQFVASGVYFYHVETPDGKSKVGRFTVVNFAQ